MLKKSSRPVSSKQGLMADPSPLSSPAGNYNRPQTPPLFPLSPRLFVGFSSKGYSDIDAAMSPTSILETKPFTPTANTLFSELKTPRKPRLDSTQETNRQPQPVGLGIVDELKRPSKPESRMVLFGSQLKIQIPSVSPNGLVETLSSPIEFGVKNRESQLSLFSPARRTPMGSANLVSGCISASEMEMSEEYTCVIAHGPNPRTTHIFDNCVVESYGDGFAAVTPRKGSRVSDDFLACCHACKKRLGQGKDIFMYRGEKAFCSRECRYQEMLFDEGMEDCSPPDTSATL